MDAIIFWNAFYRFCAFRYRNSLAIATRYCNKVFSSYRRRWLFAIALFGMGWFCDRAELEYLAVKFLIKLKQIISPNVPDSMIEQHRTSRIGWLRASVLGANDGILSTASLIVGVAAAHAARSDILITGIAGLVAGAMSMAAGEYVSVSSQADTERADLDRERDELVKNPDFESDELAKIYVGRGLESELAKKVATQLMAHDALASHARDELGITDTSVARPVQAALASACSFAIGAAFPLVIVFAFPPSALIYAVFAASLAFLAFLGIIAARMGGASIWRGATRVTFWGALAMGVTAAIGALIGKAL